MTAVINDTAVAGIDELRTQLQGKALIDGNEGYDERRAVYNGRYNRRPAVIVVPTGTADDVAAVRFAKANDLAVAVKGGPRLRRLGDTRQAE